MKKKKQGLSKGAVTAIGLGVAALGAGGYYFFGPNSKQHQKKAKAWMLDMEIEVEKKVKHIQSLTQPVYEEIIDSLATTYSKKHAEYSDEINGYAKKLKGEWKRIKHTSTPVVKKVTRSIKKTI